VNSMATEQRDLPEVLEEVSNLLSSFTIPLYIDGDRGEPVQIASGFVVRDGSVHYFISAAHVLDELRSRSLYYYISPGVTRKLAGKLMLNRWVGDRERDPMDVGVLRLSPEAPPPYPAVNKFAVDVSYLRPNALPRLGNHYAIVGFPASKSRVDNAARTVECKPYVYRNPPLPDDQYAKHGLSSALHVVLPLNLKKGFDSRGKHVHFPKPQGMSGSPIWILFDEELRDLGRTFPIVAVGTKFRKGLGIIGTDVSEVIRVIDKLAKD
jgi:hypothetical protein